MRTNNLDPPARERPSSAPWMEDDAESVGPRVVMPGESFVDLWRRVQRLAERAPQKRAEPALVLGEARYVGRATPSGLRVKATLRMTFGRPGRWKLAPLVGDDVIVVTATANEQAIPLSRRNGWQVWPTFRTGNVTVHLEFIVPHRGPKGSIEYDLRVAKTPITAVEVAFPGARLEPRLKGAVRSEITSSEENGGSTTLRAVMKPTTRLHLVGFRDLGDGEEANARVYAETLNLASVGEAGVEMFSVIRYTILYAGTREFRVAIPKGSSVVSAEGKGAFRYTLEDTGDGQVLRGQTAFPIRDSYEVSLRLKRTVPEGAVAEGRFEPPVPRCEGVVREVGWLAIEVPGKHHLAEVERARMLAIDTRQLPAELVHSAVSPILKAYRYHDPQRRLVLAAQALPEQDTSGEAVDRARAFSVVSAEGHVLTELRLTLRNRLRPSLRVTLPTGGKVRSALLDGSPVKPSRDDEGFLSLPLKRSAGAGGGALAPITLSLTVETPGKPTSAMGRRELVLPTVDLPMASLKWSVFLPTHAQYGPLESRFGLQQLWGAASWRTPQPLEGGHGDGHLPDAVVVGGGVTAVDASGAGAMPVRIELPHSGERREFERYWIDAGEPVGLTVTYKERWVPPTLDMGLGLLSLVAWFGVLMLRRRWRMVLLLVALSASYGVIDRTSLMMALAWCSTGVLAGAWRNGTLELAWLGFKEWLSVMRTLWQERNGELKPALNSLRQPVVALRVLGRTTLVAFMLYLTLELLGAGFDLIELVVKTVATL